MITEQERSQAMLRFIQAMGQCSDLEATDIQDAGAHFHQDEEGVHVQFVISEHGIGKTSVHGHEAISSFLPLHYEPDDTE